MCSSLIFINLCIWVTVKKIVGIAFSPITQYFFVFRSNACLDAEKVRENDMRKGNFDYFFLPFGFYQFRFCKFTCPPIFDYIYICWMWAFCYCIYYITNHMTLRDGVWISLIWFCIVSYEFVCVYWWVVEYSKLIHVLFWECLSYLYCIFRFWLINFVI